MALVVLLAFSLRGSWAGLSISPGYVEISLDKGRPAGQFLISNLGGEEERYRIKAIHFTLSRDGGVSRIDPDERSLAPWIKFNPMEFTLAPKMKRAIRYVITPPENIKGGEYWAAMELESLKSVMGTGKDQAGREYQLEVIPTILVPMFGTVGNVRYRGNLKEVKVTSNEAGQVIAVLVENTGEGRLRIEGKYEIRDSSGGEVEKGSIGKSYIFPGLEQIFSSQLKSKLKEGNYKVRVEFNCPQLKQPIENEFPLVWKAPLQ